MPEYLAPGVYVEEVPSGNMPIQAASTSTAGMVGMAARGPVNTPTLVTSLGAYTRLFGGRLNPLAFNAGRDALPYAVEGFFGNGGARLYVVRVVGTNAAQARLPLRVTQTTTTSAAAAAAATTVTLADVDGIALGDPLTLRGAQLTATADPVRTAPADPADLSGTVDVAALPVEVPQDTVLITENGPVTVTATAAANATSLSLSDVSQLSNGDTLTLPDQTGRVTAIAANTVTIEPALTLAIADGTVAEVQVVALTVNARWPGGWGNDLRVSVEPAHIVDTTLSGATAIGASQIQLTTAFGLFVGTTLRVGGETTTVTAVDTNTGTVDVAPALTAAHGDGDVVTSQEFTLIVQRIEAGRVVEDEVFQRLSMVVGHPRFAPDIVGSWDAAQVRPSLSGGSNLVRLEDTADAAQRGLPMAQASDVALTGGDDDLATVNAQTYIGTASDTPTQRTGIRALRNEPSLSIVAVPGQVDVGVQNALIQHCEDVRYCFGVLETPRGADLATARAHRQNFDTTRAAVYYPDLLIADSFGNPGDQRVISPAGHVLGIYARTDVNRGVHKAPANEVVRGILGFDTKLGKGEQDILNPINLNCFRDLRSQGLGLRCYGARVATSDPSFRYISVRRLFLMVEQSLDVGLQWAVFEPNSEATWARVKQSVTGFLTTVWRGGALEGVTQDEAFFVNIGYDVTMTQDDIDNGRMIAEIGMAPVKPAEFVILRISQKTREATS